MNVLQRNYKRLRFGIALFSCSFAALGILKLAQWLSGLTEVQFYAQHPLCWYVVVICGTTFMIGLAYAVKKAMDVNPNIQLRKMSDDELRGVLDDSGYGPWHASAERLIAERKQ